MKITYFINNQNIVNYIKSLWIYLLDLMIIDNERLTKKLYKWKLIGSRKLGRSLTIDRLGHIIWLDRYINILNIMFHAPMGRFQLELIYFITYFSAVVPFSSCVFLSCRPFVVSANMLENVVLTTKYLQERKTQLLNGTTVEK